MTDAGNQQKNDPNQEISGFIHSFETLGALDGPGLRTVVFMQGCPLHCKYCHNVDMATAKVGKSYSVDEVVKKVLRNKVYWRHSSSFDFSEHNSSHVKGGVTFSGGDPTLQTPFLAEVCKQLKEEGVHIAVDTSLFTSPTNLDKLIPFVDLWMVSVKHLDDDAHKDLTGVSNKIIQQNLDYLDNNIGNAKIRIRYVLLPGLTDSEEYIERLAKYVKHFKKLELLEILPYSTIGKDKWLKIYGKYELEGMREGTHADKLKAKEIFAKYGIKTL